MTDLELLFEERKRFLIREGIFDKEYIDKATEVWGKACEAIDMLIFIMTDFHTIDELVADCYSGDEYWHLVEIMGLEPLLPDECGCSPFIVHVKRDN